MSATSAGVQIGAFALTSLMSTRRPSHSSTRREHIRHEAPTRSVSFAGSRLATAETHLGPSLLPATYPSTGCHVVGASQTPSTCVSKSAARGPQAGVFERDGGEGPRRRGGGSSGSPRHPTPRHWGVAWQSGRGRGRPSRPHGDARTAHWATWTSLRAACRPVGGTQAGTSETRAARRPPPRRPGLTSTTECHLPGA